MTKQPDPDEGQFQIEAIPQPEETLSPEEADEAQGGAARLNLQLTRTTLTDQVSMGCCSGQCKECKTRYNLNPIKDPGQ
jgi:hypothetical protein